MTVAGGVASRPRKWARHDRSALVERIAAEYQLTTFAIPFLRVLPLALDASMVLNQVAYVARRGSSGLLLAVDLGLIRLYVGENTCAEVERNLVHRATSSGLDVRAVLQVWNDDVRPRLRVVDTSRVESDALERLRRRGAWSDRPTAVLSITLGAQLTIADDRDLVDEAYAVRFTAALHLVAPREAGLFDLSAHYALVLSATGLRAMASALKETVSTPGRGRTTAVVIGVIALGVLGVVVLRDPERAHQVAVDLARASARGIEELVAFRVQAGRAVPEPAAASPDDPLWMRLARVLALAPAPLTASELGVLVQASPVECAGSLAAYPLFVEGQDGWQLGDW